MLKHNPFLRSLTQMQDAFSFFRKGASSRAVGDLPNNPNNATLQDDAYHVGEYMNDCHRFWYTEWWYFNFIDPVTKLNGMVTFSVFNATDIACLGVCNLNGFIAPPGRPSGTTKPIVEYHSIKSFSASDQMANVQLKRNRIEVLDPNRYLVTAASEDGRMAMKLTYEQADKPQFFIREQHSDTYWGVSSWLNYMPSARVNGIVSFEGTDYPLKDATGYHDHDWGMWKVYQETWSWGEVSVPDKEITFNVVYHAAFQKSTSYFRVGDLRIYFPQENFHNTQEDWIHWEREWKYPTKMTFHSLDTTGRYKVEMAWQVKDTVVLWKYPLIVFEQFAAFQGGLFEKTEEGGWKEIAHIDDLGFCEYTNTWLPCL